MELSVQEINVPYTYLIFKAMDQSVQLTKLIKSVSRKIFQQYWIFVAETLVYNKIHISGWLRTLINF